MHQHTRRNGRWPAQTPRTHAFLHAHQAPAHRSGLAAPTAPAHRSGLAAPTAPAHRSGLAGPTRYAPPRSCTLAATTTMSPLSSRTRITRYRIESGDPPVLTRSDSPINQTTMKPHGAVDASVASLHPLKEFDIACFVHSQLLGYIVLCVRRACS